MPLVPIVDWSKWPLIDALAYINDIICHSQSVKDHLDHVEQVDSCPFGYKTKIEPMSPFQKEVFWRRARVQPF